MAADDYATPGAAIWPLLPHVASTPSFIEPCAGAGKLAKHLQEAGLTLAHSFDIAQGHDATTMTYPADGEIFISNPPWTRALLHPIIENLRQQKPTWLLLDADWAQTLQAEPYLAFCRAIVSVGRLKWIENSPHTGKDNACWYLFGLKPCATVFIGRRN